tara:strand:+ start:450 stop:572 length:123 start_codon:yes stop_codon:yes gene_type:complete
MTIDEKSKEDPEQEHLGLHDMVNTYGYETCGVRLTTIALN